MNVKPGTAFPYYERSQARDKIDIRTVELKENCREREQGAG